MKNKSHNLLHSVKGVSVGVWAVSISMMLIAISASMTMSIAPFFLTETLGLSLVSLGIMDGIAEGLSYLSKLGSGYAGDIFRKKKPPLLLGVIMATISKPIFILSNGIGMLMVSKVMERISNGIMATPRDAYCAEAGSESSRGASLGIMMSLKTFGVAIGSLIIGGLVFLTEDYALLLWIGFIPCALSILVLIKYMKESDTSLKKSDSKDQNIKLIDLKNLSKRYWSLVLVALLFMLARFSDAFLVLRMAEIGAPKGLCVMTVGIFNIVSAFACLPIGALSDRFDRSRMMYFSFITLILSNVCFIFADGLFLGMIGILFWGSQRGTSQMLFAAVIADEVPERIIGTALGIYYLLSGIAVVISGFIVGQVADMALNYAFVFGLIASSLALIVLIVRNEFLKHRKIN